MSFYCLKSTFNWLVERYYRNNLVFSCLRFNWKVSRIVWSCLNIFVIFQKQTSCPCGQVCRAMNAGRVWTSLSSFFIHSIRVYNWAHLINAFKERLDFIMLQCASLSQICTIRCVSTTWGSEPHLQVWSFWADISLSPLTQGTVSPNLQPAVCDMLHEVISYFAHF